MIPKRFVRIWLGPKPLPKQFDLWWLAFQRLHPDYEFVTLTDLHSVPMDPAIRHIYDHADTYAGRSDVLRYADLYHSGGFYVDTDVMPLKSFEPLRSENAVAGKRSSKSFEIAVLGAPPRHDSYRDLLDALPEHWAEHADRACSVRTGPSFFSTVMFGREDVDHLPTHFFYPYDGFMAPKRDAKNEMFKQKLFHPDAYAAHYSNHRWGGKPK